MAVAPRMTSTSPSSTAPDTSCSPNASIVPGPTTAPAAGPPAGIVPIGPLPDTSAGQARGVVEARVLRPPPASHPVKSNSGSVVMATTVSIAPTPAQRVVGDGLGRPVPGRVGMGLDQPGEEAGQLAGLRRVGRRVAAAAPGVAVEEPVGDRAAVGVDRAERRHHRRDVDGARRRGPGAATCASASRTADRHTRSASWPSSPAARDLQRARPPGPDARTSPSASAATAFTEVVPMSMPTVTSVGTRALPLVDDRS